MEQPTYSEATNHTEGTRGFACLKSNGYLPQLIVVISTVTAMESRQVMSLTSRVITLIILLVAFNGITSEAVPPGSIIMKIVNNAGAPIELFWINIFETDRPLVKQTTKPIRNNTDNVVRAKLLKLLQCLRCVYKIFLYFALSFYRR